LPETSGRGELRAVISPVRNFTPGAVLVEEDDVKRRQVRVEFMLLRSSYATVLLREIMKTQNPIKAGF
jgi:tRNA(Glu) U13 pseudouridine synthase TruD